MTEKNYNVMETGFEEWEENEETAEEFDIEEIEKSLPADDSVKMYLQEIAAYPLLSPEEEKDLSLRIAAGDVYAKEKLVNSNLRLVVSLAKKYVSPDSGMQLLDLIQEGNMGLMRAAEKFDASRGCRFTTYCYYWVKQFLTRAIADQSRLVRIPVHMQESLGKQNKAARRLTQELGRNPSDEEIAAELGISAEKVHSNSSIVPELVSLDMPVGEDKDTRFGDFIRDNNTPDPAETVAASFLSGYIEDGLQILTEREQDVIRLRYGIGTDRAYSLEEVGKMYRVTRERIRQIETKALEKLRRNSKFRELKDYTAA